ncbi:MAG: hypothetical protein [Inoviridae sp.]|nr:MAG: hypothetical protein [Inoviridae sp.]
MEYIIRQFINTFIRILAWRGLSKLTSLQWIIVSVVFILLLILIKLGLLDHVENVLNVYAGKDGLGILKD